MREFYTAAMLADRSSIRHQVSGFAAGVLAACALAGPLEPTAFTRTWYEVLKPVPP